MDSRLTPADLKALKNTVSIEQVLEERGLLRGLRVCQDRLVGPCPLHGGDNKNAFVVLRSINRWRCFTRCNTGGDVLDLLALLDGTGPYEAARGLLKRSPMSLPGTPSLPASPPFIPFTRALPLSQDLPLLRLKGITPCTARHFEVGVTHHSKWLCGFVALRLHDPEGHPLGYAGRCIEPCDDVSKWRFPKGLPKSSLLYGYHRLPRELESLVLVECAWGVLRLYQLGIPAVALMGVHLSELQVQLLHPFHRLVLLLDGDPAGRLGQKRLHEQLSAVHEVESLSLPEAMDPDDLSDEALKSLLNGSCC